jgi:hypothetical protein
MSERKRPQWNCVEDIRDWCRAPDRCRREGCILHTAPPSAAASAEPTPELQRAAVDIAVTASNIGRRYAPAAAPVAPELVPATEQRVREIVMEELRRFEQSHYKLFGVYRD